MGFLLWKYFRYLVYAPSVHDVIDLQHCMENACETTREKGGIFEPVQQSMRHHVWKWVDSILNTYYSDTFYMTEHILSRLLSSERSEIRKGHNSEM
jgi:hypothetical protein